MIWLYSRYLVVVLLKGDLNLQDINHLPVITYPNERTVAFTYGHFFCKSTRVRL